MKHKLVLVVGNNDIILLLLKIVLEKHGFIIRSVVNNFEVLNFIEKIQNPPDLIMEIVSNTINYESNLENALKINPRLHNIPYIILNDDSDGNDELKHNTYADAYISLLRDHLNILPIIENYVSR
jgi:CheY-like chemotaxis protein